MSEVKRFNKFVNVLETEFERLFKLPQYALPAQQTTPQALALKMTASLRDRTAMIDGEAVKNACKQLQVKRTCAAISAYLKNEGVEVFGAH